MCSIWSIKYVFLADAHKDQITFMSHIHDYTYTFSHSLISWKWLSNLKQLYGGGIVWTECINCRKALQTKTLLPVICNVTQEVESLNHNCVWTTTDNCGSLLLFCQGCLVASCWVAEGKACVWKCVSLKMNQQFPPHKMRLRNPVI